jgi:hypothetical protein
VELVNNQLNIGIMENKVELNKQDMEYYKSNIDKLDLSGLLSLCIIDDKGNKTKWMSLNRESVYVLIGLLERLEVK